jgi:YebC/PmpR family DNA-binding regulatory protein
MSGHSHYATTHRQKELKDAAKGKVFSKLARMITIAAKTGGSDDPNANFKLRVIIDKARAANMPKDNIDRAISKASGGDAMEEVTYEGFGPGGIGVIVEAGTDNRNRTGNEIKSLFDRGGGKFAGPGAVSFNFDHKGQIAIAKDANTEEQMLKLIDLGVDDVEEEPDAIYVYVAPASTKETQDKLTTAGFTIKSVELIQKPKTYQTISDKTAVEKVINFLDNIEEHDDVQKVYTNAQFANV